MKNILVLSILALGASASYAVDLKDIVRTCTDIELDTASISAVCTAENGGKYKTALRLRGINNHDGVLTAEEDSSIPSVFFKTCQQTSVDARALLAGKCKNSNGEYVWTTLDLRPLLKNYNGTLVYPLD